MRDHNQLKVFGLADDLVDEVYRCTQSMPTEERYGMQSQIRRAAVSVPTNIVEGCTRSTTRDYVHFLVIAHGSSAEARYLLSVAQRLEFVPQVSSLIDRYGALNRALDALIRSQT